MPIQVTESLFSGYEFQSITPERCGGFALTGGMVTKAGRDAEMMDLEIRVHYYPVDMNSDDATAEVESTPDDWPSDGRLYVIRRLENHGKKISNYNLKRCFTASLDPDNLAVLDIRAIDSTGVEFRTIETLLTDGRDGHDFGFTWEDERAGARKAKTTTPVYFQAIRADNQNLIFQPRVFVDFWYYPVTMTDEAIYSIADRGKSNTTAYIESDDYKGNSDFGKVLKTDVKIFARFQFLDSRNEKYKYVNLLIPEQIDSQVNTYTFGTDDYRAGL